MSEDRSDELFVLNWKLMHGIYGHRVGTMWFLRHMGIHTLLKSEYGALRLDCVA